MTKVKFVGIDFDKIDGDALKNTSFDSCHFSINSLYSSPAFNRTAQFDDCTFGNIFSDMSSFISCDLRSKEWVICEGFNKNTDVEDIATEMNNSLIDRERQFYQKTEKQDATINNLEQENRNLRELLLINNINI